MMKKIYLLLILITSMIVSINGQNIEVEHLSINNDCSNLSKIIIPYQPSSVVVNITGIESMPKTKDINDHAWMEVWDKQGIYFKNELSLMHMVILLCY